MGRKKVTKKLPHFELKNINKQQEQAYELKQIVNHRKRKNTYEFECTWYDYNTTDWLRAENFCTRGSYNILNEYRYTYLKRGYRKKYPNYVLINDPVDPESSEQQGTENTPLFDSIRDENEEETTSMSDEFSDLSAQPEEPVPNIKNESIEITEMNTDNIQPFVVKTEPTAEELEEEYQISVFETTFNAMIEEAMAQNDANILKCEGNPPNVIIKREVQL